MLNCTDLACVLHHHHFYAHLHHLKNHLQDDNDNAVIGDGNNISGNYVSEFDNNDVDSDLSSLSHVDAPSDTIYMVCGVVIAMLLVGLIIILVAVTISKLRKREETASATPATVEAPEYALQTLARVNDSSSTSSDNSCCGHHETQQQQHQQSNSTSISTSTTISSLCNNTPSITIIDNNGHHMNDCNGHHINYNNNNNNTNNNNHYHNNSNDGSDHDHESVTFTRTSGGDPLTNGWVFPPKAPTPNIYNFLNQDLLEAAGHGHNGFKGFRKQFSGRFKRLVSKKSEATSPIPPELKPQLKTIYVY